MQWKHYLHTKVIGIFFMQLIKSANQILPLDTKVEMIK